MLEVFLEHALDHFIQTYIPDGYFEFDLVLAISHEEWDMWKEKIRIIPRSSCSPDLHKTFKCVLAEGLPIAQAVYEFVRYVYFKLPEYYRIPSHYVNTFAQPRIQMIPIEGRKIKA